MERSEAAKPRRAVLRKAADAGIHPAEPRAAAKQARSRAAGSAARTVAGGTAAARGAAARGSTD